MNRRVRTSVCGQMAFFLRREYPELKIDGLRVAGRHIIALFRETLTGNRFETRAALIDSDGRERPTQEWGLDVLLNATEIGRRYVANPRAAEWVWFPWVGGDRAIGKRY